MSRDSETVSKEILENKPYLTKKELSTLLGKSGKNLDKKVSQPEKELAENLQALITAIGSKNIKKLVICPTMGPGIKVQV